MNFPILPTKIVGLTDKFDINSPQGRQKYFHAKAGKEIEAIKQYLDKNSFVGFLLAKKMAGKGTYAKMFTEIIGAERVNVISVGDIVRDTHALLESGAKAKRTELLNFVKSRYRGFSSDTNALNAILNRSVEQTLPTEILLTLIKKEVAKHKTGGIFIDGFPRTDDQISYSLYFREIMNLREDPDFFVLIDIPESIIEARIKNRVICPLCKTPRNLALLPTKFIKYDKKLKEFYLLCDNPDCEGYAKEKMVRKESDDLGLSPLRERLDKDGQLIQKALELHGVSRVLIRNHIPLQHSDKFDTYEFTPQYSYEIKGNAVNVIETSWVVKDDNGRKCHSLLPAPATLSMIRQIHSILVS